MKNLELIDRRLLNVLQAGFPLAEEPYEAIARELGVDAGEVLARTALLRRAGIIREIGAILDARRLGYTSVLVAAAVAPDRVEPAGRLVSAHPGVSHCYAREASDYALWFTLATAPGVDALAVARGLALDAGASRWHALPSVREFKIRVQFDAVEGRVAAPAPRAAGGRTVRPGAADIPLLRALQQDLPAGARPFDGLARDAGMDVPSFLERARALLEGGVVRRYAAVVRHRELGFRANAMGVWAVPGSRADEVGRIMAAHPAVTHCYQRPTFDDWPYSHFTMIHATTREGCEAAAEEIRAATGIEERRLLYSTREFKKARVRYFAEGRVYIAGAGPGDPDLITMKTLRCVQRADVVVYDRLVHPSLVAQARSDAELVPVGKSRGARMMPQEAINALLVERARAGRTVVRLKGGDPFVLGRGGEEAEALARAGLPFEIVPGISSAVAVPAYAGIPVTHRGVASCFTVVTGHEDPSKEESAVEWERLAATGGTLVILMGWTTLPTIVDRLTAAGLDGRTPAALVQWGTYDRQRTVTGTLADIVAKGREAGLEAPVVAVIGDVVRLRGQLNWFAGESPAVAEAPCLPARA